MRSKQELLLDMKLMVAGVLSEKVMNNYKYNRETVIKIFKDLRMDKGENFLKLINSTKPNELITMKTIRQTILDDDGGVAALTQLIVKAPTPNDW